MASPRFNPVTWNFVAKRINELFYVRHEWDTETLIATTRHFADHFEKDNPNFDREKFIHACVNKRD